MRARRKRRRPPTLVTNDSGLDLVILEPGDDGASGDDRGAHGALEPLLEARHGRVTPFPIQRLGLAGPRPKLHGSPLCAAI